MIGFEPAGDSVWSSKHVGMQGLSEGEGVRTSLATL
jgi:hypothetical protein